VKQQPSERFRPGDLVALRSPAEILATLDGAGALNGMPFMPEMLQYLHRSFTVAKRVEKVCDTICPIGGRRMRDTVFLEGLRCDGAGHGGCEAECRLYWKEAWLRRVQPGEPEAAAAEPADMVALERVTRAHARRPSEGDPVYRCQATDVRYASEPLSAFDPRQYVRELDAGNVGPVRMLRVAVIAAMQFAERVVRSLGSKLGAIARTRLGGLAARRRDRAEPLGLQPGEWVEVKSADEIARTLDARLRHRGMLFAESEMLPACGKTFQVRRRVGRIIDEATGRMLTLKNDCIVLEGFVCTGDLSDRGRRFCAREIYPYWREAWLRRAAAPDATAGPA